MKHNKKLYCIEVADRLCHNTILFIGLKKECEKYIDRFFVHKKYGGIDAYVVKYTDREKKLVHDIHKKKDLIEFKKK